MQQTSIQRKHISISHSETRSPKGFLKEGTNILWNLFLLIFMWQPNQYRCQRHFLTGQRCDAICQVAILADSPRTQETYLKKSSNQKVSVKGSPLITQEIYREKAPTKRIQEMWVSQTSWLGLVPVNLENCDIKTYQSKLLEISQELILLS